MAAFFRRDGLLDIGINSFGSLLHDLNPFRRKRKGCGSVEAVIDICSQIRLEIEPNIALTPSAASRLRSG